MPSYDCVAMLLAGGEGKRLGALTKRIAKPAVSFGGKYRIIDFTLSNCANSGIDTVGVLTQYQPLRLNSYIGIGKNWDLDRKHGGVTILPPYVEKNGIKWYKGTANAIYQNIHFIEQYQPEYILVVSGDHIYKMNYIHMLNEHISKKAEVTIAVIEVPWEETSRFGIMNTNENNRILEFEEKPKHAKSNLASMGIYIFNWEILKFYLEKDEGSQDSSHDFGKDVIPLMLRENREMYAFPFTDYWRDVGTIESLWQANMELLDEEPKLDLYEYNWRVFSVNPNQPPQYIGPSAKVHQSIISEGSTIFGNVNHSVIFYGVEIGEESEINHSVIMPNAKIGKHVKIDRAIIGEDAVIPDGCRIGTPEGEVTLVEEEIWRC